jgi:hypothetical protein
VPTSIISSRGGSFEGVQLTINTINTKTIAVKPLCIFMSLPPSVISNLQMDYSQKLLSPEINELFCVETIIPSSANSMISNPPKLFVYAPLFN